MRKNRAGKWYGVICIVVMILSLAGCGENGAPAQSTTESPETGNKSSEAVTEGTTAAKTQPSQTTAAETQPVRTTASETQPVQAAAPDAQTGGAQAAAPQQPAGNQTPAAAQGQGITEEDAKQIALRHANVSESDAVYMQVKLERDHGRDEYDVEFYAGNTEYDYEIDAATGEILSFDYDAESYTPPAAQAQAGNAAGSQNSQTSYISADQAKAAAFAHANVNEKDVSKLEVDFDQDHGKAEYEVKFDVANMEYEYEIDAVTGEVISYEMDHD